MKNTAYLQAFRHHLKTKRTQKGFSQQQLADRADIDKKTLQRIEWGQLNPSLDIVCSLADGLGISITELVGVEHEKTAP
ncbi:MAG: helix-turn-helix domain-containing protein [Chitinophagales bacterium]|nr:helix-turn-helix domain-containing protein [Chitinophagales bacterium]